MTAQSWSTHGIRVQELVSPSKNLPFSLSLRIPVVEISDGLEPDAKLYKNRMVLPARSKSLKFELWKRKKRRIRSIESRMIDFLTTFIHARIDESDSLNLLVSFFSLNSFCRTSRMFWIVPLRSYSSLLEGRWKWKWEWEGDREPRYIGTFAHPKKDPPNRWY